MLAYGAIVLSLSALLYAIPPGDSRTWAVFGMALGTIMAMIGLAGEDTSAARTSADPHRWLYDLDDEDPVMRRRKI